MFKNIGQQLLLNYIMPSVSLTVAEYVGHLKESILQENFVMYVIFQAQLYFPVLKSKT